MVGPLLEVEIISKPAKASFIFPRLTQLNSPSKLLLPGLDRSLEERQVARVGDIGELKSRIHTLNVFQFYP